MKFSGELTVKAPRAEVYKKVRDARFFASCVDGVTDLVETAPDVYAAVFETKVAYMKFRFNVTVEVTRMEPPAEIEARIEGTPLALAPASNVNAMTFADVGILSRSFPRSEAGNGAGGVDLVVVAVFVGV